MSEPEAPPTGDKSGSKKPDRDEIIGQIRTDVEHLVLSDETFSTLRNLKKAIPIFYDYIDRERRRKKRSPEFRWLMSQIQSQTPIDNNVLLAFSELLQKMRLQIDGLELPPDTGEKLLSHLQNLIKTRKDPNYWKEYCAFISGKSVSDVLRAFHPAYETLHGWDRAQYFRKVYNAIRRLVDKYGGPAMPAQPPQR